MTAYVLVHSPAVGPITWSAVAALLHARGDDAVVPDLHYVGAASPPYWPYVVDVVADAMGQLDDDGPVVLVGHSNAGLLLPAIAEGSPRPVGGAVLVDAAMPARGASPAAPPAFLERLRALAAADGSLPRWTQWWDDADVAELLPDPEQRRRVVEDQPRLPLAYYQQELPTPDPWWTLPRAYLRLSAAYDAELAEARAAGWPTAALDGGHLHQVVDPVAVEDVVVGLAGVLLRQG
ncbi:MAG TPA: alpha/beta fold hydrolase [Candidatus Nanopelagicales bacterium]|nr:alpha/beta fold hydrolase [Candidatus Nanopelagicales bacterium]